MRKWTFILLVLTTPSAAWLQQKPIFSSADKIDYGTIYSGEHSGKAILQFKNTGNAPLIITTVKSSCGCLVPYYWPKEPIMPGKKDSIVIKYDMHRIGPISKTITVVCNEIDGKDYQGYNHYKEHIIKVVGLVTTRDQEPINLQKNYLRPLIEK